MEENNYLVQSFADSIGSDIVEFAGEAVEFTLDTCSGEDSILKEIPFVSTAVKLYSIGSKVHYKHNFYKLKSFITAVNTGTGKPGELEDRKEKFLSTATFRKHELEYLLILIERYVGFVKPDMLGKLYIAYIDGIIDWNELTMYAEVIDRFLPGDREYFLEEKALYRTIATPTPEAFIRLSAFGLYEEYMTDISVPTTLGEITIPAKQTKTYKLTGFGGKLQDILSD
ncbi:MAG: hypothetical protein J6A88_06835 [Oscillospiraceae bacterium]|nr:hypothetical protein [Oscillospiraceae bacterium]